MLFEHVRDLRAPVGIPDVPAYLHSPGFSSDRLPSRSFQGTPVRHRGGHAGHFYLVEKEGAGGFTVEDVRKAGGNGLAARSPRPGVIGAGYGSGSPQFTMRTPCPPGWIAVRIRHTCRGVCLLAAVVQRDEVFRAGREAECDRIGKYASGSGDSLRSEAFHRVR